MTRRPQPLRPKATNESGYAMLLVFLMAAIIAMALYNELPRVAFEAQRTREQLLIERGEQYKRAIQLFVRKVGRYPATIEELESLNNLRFLRKRYIDPMTGKDKWRLIHVNGGVLTDSIIPKNKPGQAGQPGQDQQQANTNTFIGEGPVMGAANDPNQQQMNPALRRRASDDRPVMTQEAPAAPQPDTSEDNSASDSGNTENDNTDETPAPGAPGAGMSNQQTPGMAPGRFQQPGMNPPGTFPGQPGYNAATANQPYGTPGTMPYQVSNPGAAGSFPSGQVAGQSSSGSVYAAPSLGQSSGMGTGTPNGFPGQQGGFPGQQGGFPGQQGGFPGQQGGFPGQQGGFPGQQGGFPGQQGGFPGQQGGFPGQQGGFPGGRPGMLPGQLQPGFQQGGFGQQAQMTAFGSGNANPGQNGPGMPDIPGLSGPSSMAPGSTGMGGMQVGGGIAGVASEYTGPAIKIYNERKKYNEWEFVYDQAKDHGLAGVQRNGGNLGTSAQSMGSMPGQQPGQQPGTTGFGQSGNAGVTGGTFGQSSSFGQSSGFGQTTPQPPQPQPQQPPN